MKRASSPDRTAASALPWECRTPFGGPLLPEVNMMTNGSAGRTACGHRVARSSPRGRAGHGLARRPDPQRGMCTGFGRVAVAAELLDGDQVLDRRRTQLCGELRRGAAVCSAAPAPHRSG